MARIVSYTLFCIIATYEAIIIKYEHEPKQRTGIDGIQQKVLLISLDGLRWDMISTHRKLFPNIVSLVKKGVHVSHVENVFPTNTFPNHYSIVTGLYPESHGIVDNEMFDESTGEKFSMKNTDSKWWNEAEPIWVTNQKQGHNSGVLSWPGFNVQIGGLLPSYAGSNDVSDEGIQDEDLKPSKKKIDLVMKWLQEPAVNFAALYFEEIDTVSHEVGEHDDVNNDWKFKKMRSIFEDIDNSLAYLKDQLEKLHLENRVNVIVIGDHGHISVTHENIIRLNNFINMDSNVREAIGFTSVSIFPKPGKLTAVYQKLKHAHPKMKVYLKSELPDYMHIKNNKRTAPLLLLADPGWLIDAGTDKYYVLKQKEFERGEHGYSNLIKDMHPDFFAFGPCFKQGDKSDKIRMVDVYPLMCAIMDIKPRPNNGSLDNMNKLLSDQFLTTLHNKENELTINDIE